MAGMSACSVIAAGFGHSHKRADVLLQYPAQLEACRSSAAGHCHMNAEKVSSYRQMHQQQRLLPWLILLD
jgi:hypothetical protein